MDLCSPGRLTVLASAACRGGAKILVSRIMRVYLTRRPPPLAWPLLLDIGALNIILARGVTPVPADWIVW